MSVQKKFGGELSDEEFRKFTLYTTQSANLEDDSARAKIMGFVNEKVRISPGAIVRIKGNQIGKNSYVGFYSYVNGDVTIGENILIGPHVTIVASNHMYDPATDHYSGRSSLEDGKVTIEDGVWLTAGVVITPGVTVGRASLVCANAVVTKSVEPYSIVAGSPAQVIGHIDPKTGDYNWNKEEK